jgi:tetratricopeptide (TPR) repeat protein
LQGNVGLGKINLAAIYARAGKREQATKLIEKIQTYPSDDYVSPAWVALVKFGLGENDEAFTLLERAYEEHDGFLLYFREFPWCAEYRTDPRWLEIERKMGLSKR